MAGEPQENTASIDPITVEVIGNAIASIADEMGETLIRASYSTNIKERRDCSTVLFDAAGRMLYQAEHIPIHLGSLLGIVESIQARYNPGEISPGDMFIANDPYSGGGTHLPDIAIAAPVFYNNKPVAYVANIAHHSDVGGRVPGSNAGDSTSIFQEGLRIPVMRVIHKGVLNQELMDTETT